MSFVARFRVAARKFVYFQYRASKLGPAYQSCNERQTSCTRKRAEPRRGCPNCEWTIQYQTFLKELDAELSLVKGGSRKGALRWPRKMLLKTVYDVASLAASRDKGFGPKWTVVTSLLVSIYRDEVAKKRSIDQFNATQAADAAREQSRANLLGRPNDEDGE